MCQSSASDRIQGIVSWRMTLLATLPLIKLSSATNNDVHQKPIPWSHSNDPLNSLAIENKHRPRSFPSQAGQISADSIVLRIKRGIDLLETVEVSELALQSADAVQACHRNGVEPRAEHLSIFVVAKSPRLALRFKLGDGQVRRLQFMFRSHEDFETLRVVLNQINVSGAGPEGRGTDVDAARAVNRSAQHTTDFCAVPSTNPGRPFTAPTAYTFSDAGSNIGRPPLSARMESMSQGQKSAHWYENESQRIGPTFGQQALESSLPSSLPNHIFPTGETGVDHCLHPQENHIGSHHSLSQSTQRNNLSTHFDALRKPYASSRNDQQRPATAPDTWEISTIQGLPPKRVLPFPTPTPARDDHPGPLFTTDVKSHTSIEESNEQQEIQPDNKRRAKRKALADASDTTINAPSARTRSATQTAKKTKLDSRVQMPDSQTSSTEERSLPNRRDASDGKEWLREYAQRDENERQSRMNGLIASCLNNPDFTKFCEDLQENWRRIDLGG